MIKIQDLLRQNMQEARALHGWSQLQFANELEVSPHYVGEIEKGKKFPSARMLQRIADVFQLEPYQLFLDKENMKEFNREDMIRKMYALFKDRIETDLTDIRDEFLKFI